MQVQMLKKKEKKKEIDYFPVKYNLESFYEVQPNIKVRFLVCACASDVKVFQQYRCENVEGCAVHTNIALHNLVNKDLHAKYGLSATQS